MLSWTRPRDVSAGRGEAGGGLRGHLLTYLAWLLAVLARVQEQLTRRWEANQALAAGIRDRLAQHEAGLMELREVLNQAVGTTREAQELNNRNQARLEEALVSRLSRDPYIFNSPLLPQSLLSPLAPPSTLTPISLDSLSPLNHFSPLVSSDPHVFPDTSLLTSLLCLPLTPFTPDLSFSLPPVIPSSPDYLPAPLLIFPQLPSSAGSTWPKTTAHCGPLCNLPGPRWPRSWSSCRAWTRPGR